MFDAYTVKKVLPRLVIAAILIQLSWPIFTTMIQVTNQIAWGVEGIMYAPWGGRDAVSIGDAVGKVTSGGSTSATLVVGGGAIAAALYGAVGLGAAGLLALFITVLLALLIVFVVLAIRQAVIVGLLVLAPIALVAWILPGTEKFWKLWWESFSKLLLMYPLILLLIASGRIFAVVTAEGFSATKDNPETFAVAIVILIYFAPFFLIPKTFQLAGSAFANIAGIANNRSRGAFDRLKNFRGNKTQENLGKMKAGNRFANRNALTRGFNRTTVGLGTGFAGGFGFGERGRQAIDQSRRTAMADLAKSPQFQAIMNNDDALHAATYRSAAEAEAALTTRWNDADRARRAVRATQTSIGFGSPQAILAAQQLVSTGTGYDTYTDANGRTVSATQDMVETLARASGGNSNTASALAGFANAETKSRGRFDLAPSYGVLNELVQRQAGTAENVGIQNTAQPGANDYAGAMDRSWGSAGLYQLASGKTTAMRQFAAHHLDRLQFGDADQRRQAAISLMEMQNMLPNATGENQTVINQTMQQMRDYAGNQLGLNFDANMSVEDQIAAVVNTGPPGSQPLSPQGMPLTGSTIRGMARTYDRETSNNQNQGVV